MGGKSERLACTIVPSLHTRLTCLFTRCGNDGSDGSHCSCGCGEDFRLLAVDYLITQRISHGAQGGLLAATGASCGEGLHAPGTRTHLHRLQAAQRRG